MSEVNPYQTPEGKLGVEDNAQYANVTMFDHSTRIGRLRYLGYNMIVGSVINFV